MIYLPSPRFPLTAGDTITDIWYRFFFSLSKQPPTNEVDYGQTATGTNLATAYGLVSPYSHFSTVAAGTGCALPTAANQAGQMWIVWNRGANILTVYAQSTDTVNGAASVTIAAGAQARYVALATGVWLSA